MLREHARGGLGQVWVALDTELHREVAFKEILLKYAHGEEARTRFLREAEITGGLEHPGIVPVYGLGTYADGRPFYAMKFIKGDSLKTALEEFHAKRKEKRTSFDSSDFRQLLRRFIDVCNAMQYAHDRGVLHRDLKPGNIMLGQYGETLVVDWGLAKPLGEKLAEAMPSESGEKPLIPRSSLSGSSGETLPGQAVGTPQFMSPEQARGDLDQLGPATDIYALGATLYQILTGTPPFTGDDLGEILQQVQKGQFASPRQVLPNVPKSLDAICRKAMALRPTNRYPTPQALAKEIEHWLADEPVSAAPDQLAQRAARFTRKHRGAVAMGMAALLLIAVGATISAVIINEQRRATAQLAREKSTLAEQNGKLAEQKGKLAEQNGKLALEANTKRLEAEAVLKESRRRLAQNFFQHGVTEYAAGRVETARRDLFLAWSITDTDNPLRESYSQILEDRLTAGGRSSSLIMQHKGTVTSVVFSPDGTRVLTGSKDNTARLWDGWTGIPLGEPMRHKDNVTSVAFSPDGTRVLTGSEDKTARLWDGRTGAALGEPMRHELPVLSVAFSPDGTRVLIASGGFGVRGEARLWDGRNGAPLGAPMRHEGSVNSAVFSPDGTRVLTGSGVYLGPGEARMWDGRTGAPLGEPMRHEGSVNSVAFSPDDTRVLTGSWDKTARLWDGWTGAPLGEPMRHEGSVDSVVFSPDGTRVLTGSWDTARLWDGRTGAPLGEPMRHEGSVNSVAFSPDGNRILTGSRKGLVRGNARLWDGWTGAPLGEPMRHEGGVSSMTFSPDGARVLTGSPDNTARLWNGWNGNPLSEPMRHDSAIICVAFSADGARVLTGSRDNSARLWDGGTGSLLGEPMRHDSAVISVAFNADGARVLTESGHEARLWDGRTGAPWGEPMQKEGDSRVAISPDGTRVLTGSRDKAELWDGRTGAPLGEAMSHDKAVSRVAFSADGVHVLTGSRDKTARLWDGRTGAPLGELLRHEGEVRSVAFSPDGSRVVTGSYDKTARLWDGRTGAPLGEPMRHERTVESVAFSADGSRILTGSAEKTARLWDGQTGAPLGELLRHEGEVRSVAFSPDGSRVVTGSYDKTARLWAVSVRRLPKNPKSIWEYQTGVMADAQGEVRPLSNEESLQRQHELMKETEWLGKIEEFVERRSAEARRQLLSEAERQEDWFAVAFHLRQLYRLHPKDAGYRERLRVAEGRLREQEPLAPEFVPEAP